jgi:hypothetical protein
MKRALSTLGAATLLIGLPLAAAAHDVDHRHPGWRGHERHGHDHYYQPKYKQVQALPGAAGRLLPGAAASGPASGIRPVPPPAPRPWPFNHVDIGFRVFF